MPKMRALRFVAGIGVVLTFVAYRWGPFGLVDALVCLGASTIVPLGASLSLLPDREGRYARFDRFTAGALCVSASLAPLSAFSPHGLRVAFAATHVFSTSLLALAALRRLAWRGPKPIDELAIDAGSLFLPVGSLFALASRTHGSLFGFTAPIVGFTAAHFHYAGFAAPLILGCVGRVGYAYGAHTSWTYRWSTGAVIAAVPLTALGIAGGALLERASATLLALGMLVASMNALALLGRLRARSVVARALLACAFLGLVVPMMLAALFAWTGSAGRERALSDVVSLAEMIRFHGAANALVFALPALVALTSLEPMPRHLREGFAMSRLRGRLRIGADFFAREGALGGTRRPTGIVERLDAYAREGFDSGAVHEAVRRFYEHTEDYDLEVHPRWSRGFVLGGRLWRAIARRIGQVELPTEAPTAERVRSRIVDLSDAVDGRQGVRGWIRTYEGSGRALYVAAYAGTRSRDRLLMNIAFPLPFSALVSVLRFERVPIEGGLRVTTAALEGELVSDEGIYIATRWLTLRLPMLEWVQVLPTGEAGETTARHELFLFGRRYLTLDYRITPRC